MEKELASLRPAFYSEALSGWVASSEREESWLLRGKALQQAQKWSADKSLSDLDYRFLNASRELEQRDIQKLLEAETEANQILAEANQVLAEANQVLKKANQKANLRIRIGSLVLVITLLTALFVGLSATWSIQKALRALQLEQIKSLTLSSNTLFDSNQELGALIDALKAGKQLKQADWVDNDIQVQVTETLQQAVNFVKEHNRLSGFSTAINAIDFSPDGRLIVIADEGGKIQIWSSEGKLLKKFPGHSNAILDTSFSPNGQFIATAGEYGTVKIWTSRDG